MGDNRIDPLGIGRSIVESLGEIKIRNKCDTAHFSKPSAYILDMLMNPENFLNNQNQRHHLLSLRKGTVNRDDVSFNRNFDKLGQLSFRISYDSWFSVFNLLVIHS